MALEEVLALTEGGDDPERLKRYLFHAWKRDGIGYALLVGDVDMLPVRYMTLDRCTREAFDVAFYPADLYYADPLDLFDYCKRNFSKNVALLHDYRLYDFTLIVRKD